MHPAEHGSYVTLPARLSQWDFNYGPAIDGSSQMSDFQKDDRRQMNKRGISQVVGAACGKTREELTSALERQPIDEDNARALLLQLAAEQYDAIGNTEYETVRLRRLLTGRKPMTELDAELLQSAVSAVLVTQQAVRLQLKNGQIIGKDDLV